MMEKGRMAKGKWVKGKESARWVSAVPGLRPGTLPWVFLCPSYRLILIHAAARIVETMGGTTCTARVLRVSAILYRPVA